MTKLTGQQVLWIFSLLLSAEFTGLGSHSWVFPGALGFQTQVLMHVRQGLYRLSYALSPSTTIFSIISMSIPTSPLAWETVQLLVYLNVWLQSMHL